MTLDVRVRAFLLALSFAAAGTARADLDRLRIAFRIEEVLARSDYLCDWLQGSANRGHFIITLTPMP